jgi:ABC-2 type transport system ATP-binding protein
VTTAAVDLRDVRLSFGDVKAINHLTFSAPEEKITVLLGPNGAGKTTAMRLITGALSPSSGSVTVLGCNPCDATDGNVVRGQIGIVPAKPALYERSTGWENLRYAADIYGVTKAERDDRIREAAERFGIDHVLNKQAGEYSTGMKTRLVLARSILHAPDLLLYDEPTSGLDPESSKAVLELIREMTGYGKTVLMSTHLLVEAENLADQIVVMNHGHVSAEGSKESLIGQYFSDVMVVIDMASEEDAAEAATVSAKTKHVLGATTEGKKLSLLIVDADAIPKLVKKLVKHDISICGVTLHEPSLEDLYFASQQNDSLEKTAEK